MDLTNRPSSSMSSTATIRVRTSKNRASNLEDIPLEAIPAPPAQFNTNDDDEVNAITTENVALIRSPQPIRGNGHNVNCIRWTPTDPPPDEGVRM